MRSRVAGAAGAIGAVLLLSPGRPIAAAAQNGPFRAGVDLIAVDLQVVDRDGAPITDLGPADFQVSIQGKTRKVVSADLIRSEPAGSAATPAVTRPVATTGNLGAVTPPASIVLLAVDASSLVPSDARGAAIAARGFVDKLPATTEVGLFTFPTGPKIDPTRDHASVKAALDHVMGQRVAVSTRFPVTASEIIDFSAGDANAIAQMHIHYCGERGGPGNSCTSALDSELQAAPLMLEALAISTMQTFASVMEAMGKVPGRKIAVLVSAGVPTSDRTGGRPDVGSLPLQLGERAAQANATVYTLFLDHQFLQRNAAENRTGFMREASVGNTDDRDADLQSRWLSEFAGAAGGGFMRIQVGDGEGAFERIVRETSSYYLLGVEPDARDRDGKSHELKIKTLRKGATVRSHAWAVIPAPAK